MALPPPSARGDGNDVRNAFIGRRHLVADWRDTELAVQQGLGLWAQRRSRSRRSYRGAAGGDGPHLTAPARPALTPFEPEL